MQKENSLLDLTWHFFQRSSCDRLFVWQLACRIATAGCSFIRRKTTIPVNFPRFHLETTKYAALKHITRLNFSENPLIPLFELNKGKTNAPDELFLLFQSVKIAQLAIFMRFNSRFLIFFYIDVDYILKLERCSVK